METSQKKAERLGRDIDMHRQWLTKDFADLERMIAAGDFKALARATEEMELSIEALRRDVILLENVAVREAYTVRAEDVEVGMVTVDGTVTWVEKDVRNSRGEELVRISFDTLEPNQYCTHRAESRVELAR